MNIALNAKSFGYELVVTADNVNICEDVESRTYEKDDNGKLDYSKCKRDVSTDAIDQIASVLSDMVYYRKDDYDSSALIEQLFDRLPHSEAERMAAKLHKQYCD